MTAYFSEIYFFFLIYMVAAYLVVWMIAWLLARFIKGGNPYVNVFTCWSIPLLFHSLALLLFIGFSVHEMALNEREPLDIFLYNLGFFILFIINCVLLMNFRAWKKNVRFAS
jgi:hypothetical protein